MPTKPFSQGNEISLNGMHGAGNTYLHGASDGTVDLVALDDADSGTRWQVRDNKDGTVKLKCLGTSGKQQWLRGDPDGGSVDLAQRDDDGTDWRATFDEIDGSSLECVAETGRSAWLEGADVVSLAPSDNGSGSATRWRVTSYGIVIDP